MRTLDNLLIKAIETAVYPAHCRDSTDRINYVTLGLVGEAGELANKIKKFMRDGPDFAGAQAELGDILWYWLVCCHELGIDPNTVAEQMVSKLQKRLKTGTLHGSGDYRENANTTNTRTD